MENKAISSSIFNWSKIVWDQYSFLHYLNSWYHNDNYEMSIWIHYSFLNRININIHNCYNILTFYQSQNVFSLQKEVKTLSLVFSHFEFKVNFLPKQTFSYF